MANTGVTMDNDLVPLYNDFKLRKTCKYFTMRLSDDSSKIILDKVGDNTKTYADFLAELPANDCRYAIVNVDYALSDGQRSKIVFFLVGSRQLKSESKDALCWK